MFAKDQTNLLLRISGVKCGCTDSLIAVPPCRMQPLNNPSHIGRGHTVQAKPQNHSCTWNSQQEPQNK